MKILLTITLALAAATAHAAPMRYVGQTNDSRVVVRVGDEYLSYWLGTTGETIWEADMVVDGFDLAINRLRITSKSIATIGDGAIEMRFKIETQISGADLGLLVTTGDTWIVAPHYFDELSIVGEYTGLGQTQEFGSILFEDSSAYPDRGRNYALAGLDLGETPDAIYYNNPNEFREFDAAGDGIDAGDFPNILSIKIIEPFVFRLVPEPTTALLLLVGAAGLLIYRR